MAAPSTTWTETISDDEETRFSAYAETLRSLQRARSARSGTVHRALHAKANVGAIAEFTVLPDLPPHARAGLFETPATYRAYVRFSNGSGARQADFKADVRGMAIKVVGVDGPKVIRGMERARTQDFLLIRTPAIPFRDADEFVAVVTAASRSPLLLLPRVIARLGARRTLELLPRLRKSLNAPMTSLATTHYYSAAPVRLGAFAVHYAVSPHTAAPALAPRSAFRDDLAARLAQGPVTYDFAVQYFVDAVRTPIEDASIEWRETDSPFLTVARLTLLRQDIDGLEGRRTEDFIEALSFDPWHALEAHRPLGNIMRARSHAYRASTLERGAAPEPDGSETFG